MIKRGTQVMYKKSIDYCTEQNRLTRSILSIGGFSLSQKCPVKAGKLCFKNEKVASISLVNTSKFMELVQFENITARLVTKFDGNRTSCVIAELSVAIK